MKMKGVPKHCLTRSGPCGALVDAGAGRRRVGPASQRFLLVEGLAALRHAVAWATTDLHLERLVRVVRLAEIGRGDCRHQ